MTEDGFGWFARAAPIAVAIAMITYLFSQTPPAPEPSYDSVFGCYVAADAPPILLDRAGMHVLQPGFPTIPFRLERGKLGIRLVAEAPIRAERMVDGYKFGIESKGVGWFMPFYRVVNGKSYGVVDEGMLAGFQMLARDGVNLSYEPSDRALCSWPTLSANHPIAAVRTASLAT